ncbi:beta-galactosidase [Streptomyces sp. NBC_01795]|uniref:beta-galactosidase n=1 Tax=unclassified Streptomyces TaxID=2593676 RepID=UPI002DD7E3CA|nr:MULTISPECIES: beta-galactosidase [unclassified Streptomyces]WSA95945.1 beta-galactosidase [Streptomyces sp. NBC_01795]WSB80360.1 beta-galactosidase [Streptomyces sp. NBC_01775]
MTADTGRIHFGGDYNPDHWPEEVWAEDIRLMKEAGVSMVTAGIFSWARVEPRPGAWDFGWFDRVMDNLGDAGIRVCLATMTASPPPWLSELHPEILPQTAEGVRKWPGSRQHYCPSSPVYREHAVRLVEQLAIRYADHPALDTWHIGNEYGCSNPVCHCDVSAADFRRWLRERYGTVGGLNTAWATTFWSQRYDTFEQILPPRTTPTHPNPAQVLDYARFSDDALLQCYLAEKEVLRRVTPGLPITTNHMPHHKPVDPYAWAPHEDVQSLDFYQEPFDSETHLEAGAAFDVTRSAGAGRPWMLMEQAPSAVNWRARNSPKPAGKMRLWSWQAVAQGADAVLYFQWRQSLGGAEKFHSAMVPHGGTGTRVFREVCELGRELGSVPQLAGTRPAPQVALVIDWNSWWALEQSSHPSSALSQKETLLRHYKPLFEAGVPCDIVPPDRDLTAYKLVVVPNLYLTSEATGAALTAYVRGGGHLLVSYFTGISDECDRVHPGGYPAPLREVLGLRVEEFWPLAEGQRLALRGALDEGPGDEFGGGDLWSEAIDLEGAAAVAEFGDGELAGRPAVTRHAYGDGVAWYAGTRLDAMTTRALMDRVREDAGAAPVVDGLPEGVQATVREGAGGRFLFLLNHGEVAARIVLPAPGRDLLGDPAEEITSLTLPARGVAVVRH